VRFGVTQLLQREREEERPVEHGDKQDLVQPLLVPDPVDLPGECQQDDQREYGSKLAPKYQGIQFCKWTTAALLRGKREKCLLRSVVENAAHRRRGREQEAIVAIDRGPECSRNDRGRDQRDQQPQDLRPERDGIA